MPGRPWKLAAWLWTASLIASLGGSPGVALAGQSPSVEVGSAESASHRVGPGEVLGTIAQRYGVTLDLLRRVNRIGNEATIRVGETLVIPQLHTVAPGESLGSISNRYGVPVSDICKSSQLVESDLIKPGQQLVIPGGRWVEGAARAAKTRRQSDSRRADSARSRAGAKPTTKKRKARARAPETYRHEVRRGEVLSTIARRYAVPLNRLLELNRLGKNQPIRVGQKLLVPVTDKNRRLTRARAAQPKRRGLPRSWDPYVRPNRYKGYVTLFGHGRRWQGYAIGPGGKVLPNAVRGIQRVLASWRTGREVPLSPRLIALIVKLSDDFGGRPIRAVSGYRERSHAPNSKHKSGKALDFSVPGIPNEILCEYLRSLPNVGVGYYPNSTHVHLDVRDRGTFWVDYSRPGQKPQYRRPAPRRTPNKSSPPSDVAQRPSPRISSVGEVTREDSSDQRG